MRGSQSSIGSAQDDSVHSNIPTSQYTHVVRDVELSPLGLATAILRRPFPPTEPTHLELAKSLLAGELRRCSTMPCIVY
jgi:hypothetical protein